MEVDGRDINRAAFTLILTVYSHFDQLDAFLSLTTSLRFP